MSRGKTAPDITGQTFGRLTVVSRAENNKRGKAMWTCQCSCGQEVTVLGRDLRSGHTKSCGCYKMEKIMAKTETHAMSHTDIYFIWSSMKQRCGNSKHPEFENYGGRGIEVCQEWRDNFEPFLEWALSNGYQKGLNLGRKNINGNYEPSNCTFVTNQELVRNRTVSRYITYNGKTQTLLEWANETGLRYGTLLWRIRTGWPVDCALFEPVHRKRRNP